MRSIDPRWWPAILVGAAVLTLSLVPLQGSVLATAGSGTIAGVGVDTLLHVVDYAALAVALCYAMGVRDTPGVVIVVGLAVLVGGSVELAQAPMSTRRASWLDLLADGLGGVLGAAGWLLTRRDWLR